MTYSESEREREEFCLNVKMTDMIKDDEEFENV